MLSKSRLTFIKSLHTKKNRVYTNLFIVEGLKIVSELISSNYRLETIYCTEQCISVVKDLITLARKNIEIGMVSVAEMEKISLLTNPSEVLAVVTDTKNKPADIAYPAIACDSVQDPGNLGTILRVADWFDFPTVILSPGCVEWQNPKVIQASMGSFLRLAITVRALKPFLRQTQAAVYGAVMDGESIYDLNLTPKSILLLGNEGHGIDSELRECISSRITIPRFGGSDSLNVGVAAGILCYEIRRSLRREVEYPDN